MKSLLERVLMVQSESLKQWRMFAFIIRELTKMKVEFFVHAGNIYVTKTTGEAPDLYPCVIAHMDTVHRIVEDLTVLKVGDRWTGFNRVSMSQTGIGGDDKVGIYIALECLKKFENIKLVFFRDEEIGCVGSDRAMMGFFSDCSFVLQCDRKGNSDFITNAGGTKLCSKHFEKTLSGMIKKYGYKYGYGLMTDVMQLKDNKLNVSCANISCGYYNPHTEQEYVDTRDVNNCLEMVSEIITKFGNQKFVHEYEKPKYSGSRGYTSRLGKEGGMWEDEYDWKGGGNKKKWWERPVDSNKVDKQFDEGSGDLNGHRMPCDGCHKDRFVKYYADTNAFLCSECKKYFD